MHDVGLYLADHAHYLTDRTEIEALVPSVLDLDDVVSDLTDVRCESGVTWKYNVALDLVAVEVSEIVHEKSPGTSDVRIREDI